MQNETRQEATLEAVSDSTLAATVTRLLRSVVSANMLTTDTDLLAWTLLTYDTSRPPVDSTGRPPLQSELRANLRHHRETSRQLQAEQTDTLRTVVVTAGHSEKHQKEHSERQKTRKPVCHQYVAWLILLVLLAAALRWLWGRIRD